MKAKTYIIIILILILIGSLFYSFFNIKELKNDLYDCKVKQRSCGFKLFDCKESLESCRHDLEEKESKKE